jgi:DNA-binding XRE family transcriptional regulator
MTVTELPRPVDRTISATVKGLYSGRGMTADDVARAIGVSHGTIVARLRCATSWTAAEVQSLADYFRVSRDDLFTGMNGVFPGPVLPRLDSNQEPTGNKPALWLVANPLEDLALAV